jgi:adenylate cyclase class IV
MSKEEFHRNVTELLQRKRREVVDPLYVVSCDDYYLREGDPTLFVRFRKGGGSSSDLHKYEMTLKKKEDENVVRTEINVDVTNNHDSAVVEFLTLSGYKKAFSVFKEAWIWFLDDSDLSYYTLSDGRNVIEIEAKDYPNVEEGVRVIKEWQKDLNIPEDIREERSLFEIYTQEIAAKEDANNG